MLKGRVYFIGAGPGNPELITVKGKRLIDNAALVLYAGSLVPRSIMQDAKGEIIDSSPLTLEQCHKLMQEVAFAGKDVARVHTGDPSLYGTIREQIHLLSRDGIEYEVIPGVTSACAAAAAAGISFTVPEITQSLVLTRIEGRTPVPESEQISAFAAIGCSMAVYLSASKSEELQEQLCKHLPAETAILCAYRVGWPEQRLIWTTAKNLHNSVLEHGLERQTIFLILPAQNNLPTQSRLYAADFQHGWRK